MERLTGGPWENGNFYTYWNILPKNKGMDRNLQKVINALGLYEQTGLTPAEIAAMQAELAAYREDEKAGRSVDGSRKMPVVCVVAGCAVLD